MSKKTLAPSVTSRDSKGQKFISIVEAAYNKAGLFEEEAQRVNEAPGLADVVSGFIANNRHSNQYADEEVEFNYGYLSGYKLNRDQPIDNIIADFEVQLRVLHGLFNCGTRFNTDWLVRAHVVCPVWIEKFFAHFDWRFIAPTYGEAVEKVLAMIASKRKFCNYRNGQLGAEYLRQRAKTVKMFRKLGDEQKDFDILVVPAQFGLRHKGRSVCRAREVFAANEFGLGAFVIGIMLLTHPEREVQWEQLHVDCAGDEFAPDADGDFSDAPVFHFYDDEVRFFASRCDSVFERYGSASAFVSPSSV